MDPTNVSQVLKQFARDYSDCHLLVTAFIATPGGLSKLAKLVLGYYPSNWDDRPITIVVGNSGWDAISFISERDLTISFIQRPETEILLVEPWDTGVFNARMWLAIDSNNKAVAGLCGSTNLTAGGFGRYIEAMTPIPTDQLDTLYQLFRNQTHKNHKGIVLSDCQELEEYSSTGSTRETW